jgi:arylsulfatase A-like enzyme
MKRLLPVRILLFALLLSWLAGCSAPREPRKDVLLLVVDTLRADHLPLYGYPRPTSPALERFAEEAIVFETTVSPAPWTLPAVASMLTSTYPSVHGLRSRSGSKYATRMRPGLATLTEAMADAGYRTAAVVSNPWVSTAGHGLRRGFDEYHDTTKRTASEIHAVAREILERSDPQPLFLYLHYMDVHGPYRLESGSGRPKLGPMPRQYVRQLAPAERDAIPKYLLLENVRGVAGYVEAYDQGIVRWDRAFGEFINWLDASDRLEHSIVSVTSDHGEEFFEHGGWNHGLTVYEDQIAVPWVLRIPGVPGRRVSDRLVSGLDMAPTLLGLIDSPVPETMIGLDVLTEEGDPQRTLFSQSHIRLGGGFRSGDDALVAMRRGEAKWILDPDGDRCFQLGADVEELDGVECAEAGLAEARRWREEIEERGRALGKAGQFEISPAEQKRLKELGYGN